MAQNISRILVIGATGTIGSIVIDEAHTLGMQVVAGTRNPSHARDIGADAVIHNSMHMMK